MNHPENKNFNVLVVDDNLENIKVIGNCLRESNYTISYSTDGKQAIELLCTEEEHDLILLDIDMPVMNGYDTCIAIRNIERLKETPIIFLTAYNDANNIVKGFECGAQDYIAKPYNAKELLARVDTQLQLKHKNDQIRMMNEILEQRVKERTIELTEANEKLAVLDKTKNDFLSLISHEMRTPLNGIVGFAEILKSMVEDSEQKEFAQYLVQSADRLSRFSEVALLVTSLKLNKYDFSIENYNLELLVNSVINRLNEKLSSNANLIIKNINTDVLTIAMDESLIRFSVMGIIENAIKFSPAGEIIQIDVTHKDDFVRISVKDNGPGFSDEAMSKLFELFISGDSVHRPDGLGLTLATTKMIMDLHKGKVEVYNQEKGAEVNLYIPLG
jgi:two-component system sensor histidine kinase/response regulator